MLLPFILYSKIIEPWSRLGVCTVEVTQLATGYVYVMAAVLAKIDASEEKMDGKTDANQDKMDAKMDSHH